MDRRRLVEAACGRLERANEAPVFVAVDDLREGRLDLERQRLAYFHSYAAAFETTSRLAGQIAALAVDGVTPEAMKALPLKRFGTPADHVGMCKFLLSDEASWITGQIFNVDGGQVYRP